MNKISQVENNGIISNSYELHHDHWVFGDVDESMDIKPGLGKALHPRLQTKHPVATFFTP